MQLFIIIIIVLLCVGYVLYRALVNVYIHRTDMYTVDVDVIDSNINYIGCHSNYNIILYYKFESESFKPK